MIDAHVHIWRIGHNGHTWPGPDLPDIHRDFRLSDPGAPDDVHGVVLVQSQPCEDDTLWLLDAAAGDPAILAVVGWTDLAAPEAAQRIAMLARQPKLRGLRPMLQGLDDDAWILRPEIEPALAAMVEHGLSFDALVFTRHLPHVAELARRWPDLIVIVDHGAKPPLARPETLAAWRGAVAEIARLPNVACKLSGLITEAGPDARLDEARACADHLLDVFGPQRLIWGSDWPVVTLRCGWRDWRDWTKNWLSGQPQADRDAILGGNAARFYALNRIPA